MGGLRLLFHVADGAGGDPQGRRYADLRHLLRRFALPDARGICPRFPRRPGRIPRRDCELPHVRHGKRHGHSHARLRLARRRVPHLRRGAAIHRRWRVLPQSRLRPARALPRRAGQGGDLLVGPDGLDERLGHHQCADHGRALHPGDEAGRFPAGLCGRRRGLRIDGRRADAPGDGRDRLYHGDLP